MVILPNFMELFSSWHISELFKNILMIVGNASEIIGVILMGKGRKKAKQ